MSGVRFTAYFGEDEERMLREFAEAENTSMNYVVRCAVRHLFGKDVPKWMTKAMREARHAKAR